MSSTANLWRGFVLLAAYCVSAGSGLSVKTARAANTALTVAIAGLDGNGRFPDRSAFCPPFRSDAKDVSPGPRPCQAVPPLFLTGLVALHAAGRLRFFGDRIGLGERSAFLLYLAPVRTMKWVVFAKPPFGGPEAVLAYLSRYTHRIAISNRRLIALEEAGVTFRYKDYRRDGDARHRTMTLSVDEFIRRFLVHVLPKGLRRIRHYVLLASAGRKANIARARDLLAAPAPIEAQEPASPADRHPACPCCGGRMLVIESFDGVARARAPPPRRWRSGQ